MLQTPRTAICTICYLLLSCGHRSLLSVCDSHVRSSDAWPHDNYKLYKLWQLTKCGMIHGVNARICCPICASEVMLLVNRLKTNIFFVNVPLKLLSPEAYFSVQNALNIPKRRIVNFCPVAPNYVIRLHNNTVNKLWSVQNGVDVCQGHANWLISVFQTFLKCGQSNIVVRFGATLYVKAAFRK